MILIWEGERVAVHVELAAAAAQHEIVTEAASIARGLTPVLTGQAAASVEIEPGDDPLRTTWGGHVPYFIFLEVGARGRAGIHMLRRAADSTYPRLAGAIRRRLAL